MSSYKKVSPKQSDEFRPHLIKVDLSLAPIKENTESVRSVNFPSEIQLLPQPIVPTRTSIHVKKVNLINYSAKQKQ
ncbi:unnamed protein product (macronuclear) [Paramecium tetraurelia]|uniref:Uncharacterized protein n=1 Tax=Paramecium tetraurelia TaxID=5888 RepID=A0DKH6_PARTE|nr:uncharacterized protein GSPATT00017873001 [Paramecium tetraurelia]CAK83543.1 unnamed protein product [Paramecium tetraurelia]|eukprot:XP_001450940.1 hypothetical protein (macronuclear) [Paramecium tetraurelia strain d4-2]